VVVGLLSYLFVTHYFGLFDRGDGVKHVFVSGPVLLLLVSRRLALYSLVFKSGWLYVTVLHP
jgi:hypothetical protein